MLFDSLKLEYNRTKIGINLVSLICSLLMKYLELSVLIVCYFLLFFNAQVSLINFNILVWPYLVTRGKEKELYLILHLF